MAKGIKQGAVESPVFFSHIAEVVMLDTVSKYGWRDAPSLFPGLPPEEMMYMDDGIIWNGDIRMVETRAHQLSVEFAAYGLRMNASKCHLYVGPNSGDRDHILLNGIKVVASPTLEVMGVSLRVGGTVYELVAPASSRARAKFWELRHLFRTKGYMKTQGQSHGESLGRDRALVHLLRATRQISDDSIELHPTPVDGLVAQVCEGRRRDVGSVQAARIQGGTSRPAHGRA